MLKLIPLAAVLVFGTSLPIWAQEVPHGQSKPPGPALSPEEAVKKMTVPDGFTVEIVASEPNIVNPVAMAFDERGRAWITESLEYPRKSPGPGRDRVKVLEDTNNDGKMDKFTVFADGLNIPSGIAVGWGGVWVVNSPDLLFMQDTNGDGKADVTKTVLTGFGRTDTHELPNSLTWGPDGYLYGLNGVFNYCDVSYGKDNPNYKEGQSSRKFTCAMFRVNPRTWEFEIFSEGTSNPWGIAFNPVGDAFISACVIDHLWHIAEDGYYHRQGGPYPPFTWKLQSIVKHKHQKAAYCGITYMDSDVYPAEYNNRLMMGNIHGNCINVDVIEDKGSSYFGKPNDDFLSANDAWFMPVVQKVGPDGCLWVLDWYDRYHCYQDANRDPEGIDRLKGRLYRVRYKDSPRAGKFDLAKETDLQLVRRLESVNVYFRNIAQRLLSERLHKRLPRHSSASIEVAHPLLENVALGKPGGLTVQAQGNPDKEVEFIENPSKKVSMHALWAIAGTGELSWLVHRDLLNHKDPDFRAWGVRIAGNMRRVDARIRSRVQELCTDKNPRVLLQAAVAINKIENADKVKGLFDVLNAAGDDEVIPKVVWQNLHPHIGNDPAGFLARLESDLGTTAEGFFPRIVDRVLAEKSIGPKQIAALVKALVGNNQTSEARDLFKLIADRAQTGQIGKDDAAELLGSLKPVFEKTIDQSPKSPLEFDALCAAASLGDKEQGERLGTWFKSLDADENYRLRALAGMVQADTHDVNEAINLVKENNVGTGFGGRILDILGRTKDAQLAPQLIETYPQLAAEVKPRAIELLTSRTGWSRDLLAAIDAKKISASDLNSTQVRKLFANPDKDLKQLVTKQWGTLRTERDPAREELINRMRRLIRTTKGDPHRGVPVFKKLCGQCHKMYGEGQEVGPDITLNGRNSFEQLLSNVFDPSLVIGSAYQATTVLTDEGKVISGLLVEDSPQRVILKIEGGKQEIIPRDNIDEMSKSNLSLMPEGIEKQLKPQEIVDLFAYITLDKPPTDPTAKKLPGSGLIEFKETQDAAQFPSMVSFMLPGFTTSKSGHDGVAILPNHEGRAAVRVHPISREEPNVITGNLLIPESGTSSLKVDAGRHSKGDWVLIVKINGKQVMKKQIDGRTTPKNWQTIDIDLSKHRGETVKVDIESHAVGRWNYEFAYYSKVELITE
jgi:putative heme-binding domain-containing protein